MSHTTLRLALNGEVATLTLIARKGVMGPDFWREVGEVLPRLAPARALIVRGEDIFSAGLDLKTSLPVFVGTLGDQARTRAAVVPMHAAFEGLADLPIPVIAAVHGWCVGAGLELISACDFRLCSADARFSLPEVRLGITADLGGLQRLPGIVGQGWARHLAMTGEAIDAAKAEQIGLVTEVLPTPDELFARAGALALHLSSLPPKALEGTKRVMNAGLPHTESLRQAVDWNAEHMRVSYLEAALKR